MKLTKLQQKYNFYRRCVFRLKDGLKGDLKNEISLSGMVKHYEMTLELGWKVMKEYLVIAGSAEDFSLSKSVVKAAFKSGLKIDAPPLDRNDQYTK